MNFEYRQQFLHHSQSLLFNEKLEKGSLLEKADILRSILAQLDSAFHNHMIEEENYDLLLQKYNEQYSAVVDTLDSKTGLNNFADGALAICSLHKNESQKWKSSLSIEECKNKIWFPKMLNNCQIRTDHLLPQNKRNAVLIQSTDSSKAIEKAPSQFQILQGTSHPLKKDIQQIARNNFHFKSKQYGIEESRTSTVQCPDNSDKFGVSGVNLNSSIESRVGEERKDLKRKPLFSSNGTRSADSFSHGTFINGNQHSSGFSRNNSNNMKRPFQEIDLDTSDDQCEVPRQPTGPFRTAKEQLNIDNQKKYNKGRGQVSTMSYGTAKKSLGTRRGPSSKFVPPVMNREEDDGGNPGVSINAVTRSVLQKGGGGNGGGSMGGEEPVDERLKGIEPKMIELIMNEIMDHGPGMSWDDIAGLEFAKKTIKEIVVWPMLRPDIFTGLRGPPKGLLLFGPPGTGKTLIGKCIASQSKSTFFSISASSLTSKWVGEGEKMVRAMFAVARCNQPAVVFIDEIDSLLSQRSDGEHEASRRIKTEFLVQLDGAATVSEDRILVIGATNRPQEIDEAARRRFVKRLYIPLPEGLARRQIVINLLSQQKYQLSDAQLESVVQKSDGYSGADMANLCREAALGPIRCMAFGEIENIAADQVRPILYEDFEAALMQVRASVSDKDLDLYIEWNQTYGSASVAR